VILADAHGLNADINSAVNISGGLFDVSVCGVGVVAFAAMQAGILSLLLMRSVN
jgi:hypothetical protein